MKNLLFASCLSVAALFAFSTPAKADHWHHGHGGHHAHHAHHHGHVHWHGGFQVAPRYVYRPYPVYRTYPVYPSYPVYDYYYPSTSLYIGGRNFAFGVSGF